MVQIKTGDTYTDPKSIFDFGLANTVQDMWDAEVYLLATLIAFFSGAWPYIKLFTMFLCWMLPPNMLPLKWRHRILVWLDILGKWSLIDAFVLVLLMVAFYFTLEIVPSLIIYVTVQPVFGFNGFLIATMMSLISGHIVLYYHRVVVADDEKRALRKSEKMNNRQTDGSSMQSNFSF